MDYYFTNSHTDVKEARNLFGDKLNNSVLLECVHISNKTWIVFSAWGMRNLKMSNRSVRDILI
jgi:hypothetical protein